MDIGPIKNFRITLIIQGTNRLFIAPNFERKVGGPDEFSSFASNDLSGFFGIQILVTVSFLVGLYQQ